MDLLGKSFAAVMATGLILALPLLHLGYMLVKRPQAATESTD